MVKAFLARALGYAGYSDRSNTRADAEPLRPEAVDFCQVVLKRPHHVLVSAPAGALFKEFGFTVDNLVAVVRGVL